MFKRVLVSSTFVDLKEFRSAVRKSIRQFGAVDIAMENFGARDERPKEECIRLITEETDIFVGIYAHRYGYIPDGDEASITEAEYDAATEVGVRRLIYLIDEKTPWIPANIEEGIGRKKLKKFKDKLKANHICEFFSDQHELAAKVIADLARHFSDERIDRQFLDDVNTRPVDPEREYRLIKALESSDEYEVKRSIVALTYTQSPWLINKLSQLVFGEDEGIAELAISALREIKIRASAKAIADGLSTRSLRIRSWAAFELGEMALSGRRDDARSVITQLIEVLKNRDEDVRVLDEVVHSISKIGGEKALDSLINVLKSDGMPAQLKARALHGPGRFWMYEEDSDDSELYKRFLKIALPIIEEWCKEICRKIQDCAISENIRAPLSDAIASRALES